MDPIAQLQSLEGRVGKLVELISHVQSSLAGLCTHAEPEDADLVAVVQEAIAESRAVRDDARLALGAAGVSPEWADCEALLTHVRSTQEALAARQAAAAAAGLRRLADALHAGWVTHHLTRTRIRLNGYRQAAVAELRAAGSATGPLPGPPDADNWLAWFWSAGDAVEPAFDDLRDRFPALAEFLEAVTREQWLPGSPPPAPPAEVPVVVPPPVIAPDPASVVAEDPPSKEVPVISPPVVVSDSAPVVVEANPPTFQVPPAIALPDPPVIPPDAASGDAVEARLPADPPVARTEYVPVVLAPLRRFTAPPLQPRRPDPPVLVPVAGPHEPPAGAAEIDGQAFRRAIWKLVEEGRVGLAYQLAAAVDDLEPSHPGEPAALFQAAALAPFVRASYGEVVEEYQTCVLVLADFLGATGTGDELGMARRILLVGLALRPTLLAPGSGATSILEAVGLLDATCPGLGRVRQAVLEFGAMNLELSPSVLKGVRDHARWDAKLQEMREEVRLWLDANRKAKIIYAATTDVWKQWLRESSQVGHALQAVIDDRRAAEAEVRKVVGYWASPANQAKELKRTDEEIRGNGARRRPIEARARTEIFERVREFVRLARGWLEHLGNEPRTLDDYRQRRADQVREAVQAGLPQAVAEVDQLATSAAASSPLPAAAHYTCEALRDLQRLFDPAREESVDCPPVRVIVGDELLAVPGLPVTPAWRPAGPADAGTARKLLALAGSRCSLETAFRVQEQLRNHIRTGQAIDALKARGADPALVDRLVEERAEAIRSCRAAFLKTLADVRVKVERAVCYGLISGDDRNRFSEVVETYAGTLDDVLDFDKAEADLRGVHAELEARETARVRQVQGKLDALVKDGLSEGRQEDIEVIRAALTRGDFLSADEYLELVRTRQPLDRHESLGCLVLRDFFAGADGRYLFAGADGRFCQRFNDYMEGSREGTRARPSHRDLIDRIRVGESVGPIGMKGIPLPQAKEAAAMVEAWFQLKAMKRLVQKELQALLTGFGFQDVSVEPPAAWKSSYWLASCRTAPLSNPDVCIVPQYGSLAEGSYRVLGVYDRPDEESLVALTKEVPGPEQPLVVLYFGRMTDQRRRDLAEFCWEKDRGFLTIDESLVFYLCGQRFHRLPILFQCALPFTVSRPYTTTASLVPIEMFFGRHQERDQLLSPNGPNLVYGGRQLGKSALLRDVERRGHDPAAKRIVRWIDLKNKGIGIDRPVEDLWGELGQELHQMGVLKHPATNPTTVIDRVKEWLKADSERRILFLLDEADAFLEMDSRNVNRVTKHSFPEVSRLKGLMDDTDRRFKVVFAGLHNVQRVARDPNTPLGHLGTPVCVGPLLENGEWRQARDLIEVPLRHMGYELDPPDLWMRVLSYTNYYPSLIQVFCKHLLAYLHKKERSFDFRRCPPYPVTAEQVEQVYQSEPLQKEVRHKFELTLGLDPRYRLIALRIALDSLEHPAGQIDGVGISWVRSEALSLWPEGFPPEDRSYELYRTILDEMVGLGLLRTAGEDHYALRSPNVLNLLGSKDQIEMALMDVMALPPASVFVHASFRRAIGDDPWARSPLTADQEATLTERDNGVVVVCGTRLSGLDDFVESLRAIPKLAGVSVAEAMAGPDQFQDWLDEVDAARTADPEGVTLAVVVQSSAWDAGWVQLAAAKLKTKKAATKRFLRIVFVTDPERAWHTYPVEDLRRLGATEISLRPWHESAVRRWLEDIEFGDAYRVCEGMQSRLGGWYLLVAEFARRCRENSHNWQAVLGQIRGRWPQDSAWAGCCDIPPAAIPCLKAMAEWKEAISEQELGDCVTPDAARRTIEWADRFAYIRPAGKNDGITWELDPIVRDAVAVATRG